MTTLFSVLYTTGIILPTFMLAILGWISLMEYFAPDSIRILRR